MKMHTPSLALKGTTSKKSLGINTHKNLSLGQRIFMSSGVVLCIFLGLVALMLNSIFSISLEKIVQDKLKLQTYQLLSIADNESGTLYLPTQLTESRFNSSSGSLLAFVSQSRSGADNDQQNIWRSLSAQNKNFSFPSPNQGQWFFGRAKGDDGTRYYVSSYKTKWPSLEGQNNEFIFTVMEGIDHYQGELSYYRIILAVGLSIFALIFLLLQTVILRWGLKPIRNIATDVNSMTKGQAQSLTGQYPKELQPLTTNLNTLIDNERQQRERYRERMADLSHSLKTPLSVLRGATSDVDQHGKPVSKEQLINTLDIQVKKMTDIVHYQLQRAVSGGTPTSFSPVNINEHLQDIISALDKVYSEKGVSIEIHIPPKLCFYGDSNDLIEMIGNLLDNAYKHCKKNVRVSASKTQHQQLQIIIENDGLTIPPEKRSNILQRGVRLDSSGEGHGFGLSITTDILNNYKGHLSIKDSILGGASFTLTIPSK